MNTISIFHYQRPGDFLTAAWTEKKQKNPSFSQRSWAKKLGFEGNAPLSLMMQGKRSVPSRYVPLIAEDLGLSGKEKLYFETMIEFDRARDEKSRQYYQRLLSELHPEGGVNFHKIQHEKILENPLHFILLEAATLGSFNQNPQDIKNKLAIKASIKEIEECLKRLISVGLVEVKEGNKLERTIGVYETTYDVPNTSLKAFHYRSSELAQEALDTIAAPERGFDVLYLNLSEKEFKNLKQKVHDFLNQLVVENYQADHEKDKVYQMNLQLFPVFRKK